MSVKKYTPMAGLALFLGGSIGSCHYSNEFLEVQKRENIHRLVGYQTISKTIDAVVDPNSMNEADRALTKDKPKITKELGRLYRLPDVQAGEAEMESIVEKFKYSYFAFFAGFGLSVVGLVLNRRRGPPPP